MPTGGLNSGMETQRVGTGFVFLLTGKSGRLSRASSGSSRTNGGWTSSRRLLERLAISDALVRRPDSDVAPREGCPSHQHLRAFGASLDLLQRLLGRDQHDFGSGAKRSFGPSFWPPVIA